MSFRIPYRGAGIAFIKQEKDILYVYMGKRSRHPFKRTWSIPGGSVEKKLNESDLDAAKRELKEETSLSIGNSKYLGFWQKKFGFLFCWTTFFFLTTQDFSNAVPNEFYELSWINFNDLKKKNLRPFTRSEMKTGLSLLKSN